MLAEVLEDWDPFSIEVFAELFGRFADALEAYAVDDHRSPPDRRPRRRRGSR